VIDEEIRQVIDLNYQRAEQILKDHIDILHNMAHALLAWETLDKYQIDALMQGELIAEPEPVITEAVVTEIKFNQGDSTKKPNLATS
jgi:cell division protease FtsH